MNRTPTTTPAVPAMAPASSAEELEESESAAANTAPPMMKNRPPSACRAPTMKRMTRAAFAPPGISIWAPGYPPGPPG
ncbi:hypothetical protein [Streptomyces sp. TE12347]